ncbi:MAG: PQQ-dependent sugar dehydrogenase [Chloroflexota bacterium]
MVEAGTSRPVIAHPSGSVTTYLPAVIKAAPHDSLTLTPVISGLTDDTIVAIASAGDERLFVATQRGVIYVAQDIGGAEGPAAVVSTFLDIQGEVAYSFEEGLLGLVFQPNYLATGHFYVTYTAIGGGDIVLARYTVSAADPDVADPSSRLIMLSIPKPDNAPGWSPDYSPVHNAGDLHFGPDGYLYMATGDGGPDPYLWHAVPGDPNNHSQRTDVLLGKILRLAIDGRPESSDPDCGAAGYVVPADNPFVGVEGACDEIWSLGWRNPWRFSFDRLTGDLYVADVGEWNYEEINRETAGELGGRNYGWHCYEGTHDHTQAAHLIGQCTDVSAYTFPWYQYNHFQQDCTVIGGYVYRGKLYRWLQGEYFLADFCSGRIWRLAAEDEAPEVVEMNYEISGAPAGTTRAWTTFGQDSEGELYLGSYLLGVVYKVTAP